MARAPGSKSAPTNSHILAFLSINPRLPGSLLDSVHRGGICPAGAYIKRWTSVLLLSNYCVRYKLMKGLYYPVRSTDNAPPHSGHYTLQYTAATKSWKDLLRGICSQYFHCQQVHLWKVNECVFFMSPNFSPNWGLSWKDTKSCSKPYSTKIVWKERFFIVATFHWNLKLQLYSKGSFLYWDQRELHLI